jgi:hypothetical protein
METPVWPVDAAGNALDVCGTASLYERGGIALTIGEGIWAAVIEHMKSCDLHSAQPVLRSAETPISSAGAGYLLGF